MKIFLRTLSPTHIGTGEELFSLDYIIHQNNYYRISQNVWLRFLETLGDKFEELVDRYSAWVEEKATEIHDLKENRRARKEEMGSRDYNQTLSQLQQDFNLMNFAQKEDIQKPFLNFLNHDPQVSKYRSKLGRNPKRLQVRGHITTANHAVYIPGTSIKGALRTALLYKAWKTHGKAYHKELANEMIQDVNQRGHPRQIAKRVGKGLEYTMAFGELGNGKKNDVQQDIFKFLMVSDAYLKNADDKPSIEVVKTDLYLVTKVPKGRNSREMEFRATQQRQSPSIEAISEEVVFETKISLNVDQMWAIKNRLKAPGKREEWEKFEEKVKVLFGIDLDEIKNKEQVKAATQKAEDYMQEAISEFAKAQIAFEKKWVNENFLKEKFDNYLRIHPNDFPKGFENAFTYNFSGQTLLRIGYGTGFASSTELLYLISDDSLRRAMTEVMRNLEIGKRPGTKGKYEPNLNKFPKSRTLITYENQVSPLGWVEWLTPDKNGNPPRRKAGIREPEKPKQKIIPQYPKQRIREGSVIDAFVFSSSKGPSKKIRLYIGKGKDTDMQLSYRSDAILGKIIRVEVTGMQGDQITSIQFKGIKRENR